MQLFDILSLNLLDICPSLDELTVANINVGNIFLLQANGLMVCISPRCIKWLLQGVYSLGGGDRKSVV